MTMTVSVEPLLLSVEDAGQVLGISRAQMFRLIRDGRVGTVKLGSRTKVAMDSLRDYTASLLAEANITASGQAR